MHYTYVIEKIHLILFVVLIFIIVNGIVMTSGAELVDVDVVYMNLLLSIFTIIFFGIDYYRYIHKIVEDKRNKLEVQELHEKVLSLHQMNDEVNDYITKWVHELKVPISVARLVSENVMEPESRELYLELDRMDFLTNQLLFMSRSQRTEYDIKIEHTNARDVVVQVVKSFKRLLINKNISVDIQVIDKNYLTVLTDKKWFAYILSQVIHNSYKYTDDNGCINVTFEGQESYSVIRVSDEGVGVKTSELNQLFNRGFVGYNGRNSSQSTGFGLYLSRKIGLKLGIDLNAALNNDKGLTITIIVPRETSNPKMLKKYMEG